ncbi:uncharacterized protein LOC111692084 isoform X1 [Anoplophora glabripennis]|uniref:uncharacterized protein LOC111692084 isoform X1 n=1 Tax=Anoplophora glabripennis TaxID=217634 RepID=UPI000C774F0F|nr:uncharacterized protein LOC111692084 isoform X1 [Anoplophora glabripennis]
MFCCVVILTFNFIKGNSEIFVILNICFIITMDKVRGSPICAPLSWLKFVLILIWLQKRPRSVNWEEKEKLVLLDGVKDNIKVLECKRKLTTANRDKAAAWNIIKRKLEVQGYFRDIPKIKQEWQRLKVQAKKNICSYKKDKLKTGGGPAPNEPTELDWIIYDLIPYEFQEDTSAYDCDQNKTEENVSQNVVSQIQDNLESVQDDIILEFQDEQGECITTESLIVEKIVEKSVIEIDKTVEKTTEAATTPSKPPKTRKQKLNHMTEYENKLYDLNKKRIELQMQQLEEMHKLRMKNEKEYHQRRLELLEINKYYRFF